MVLRSFFALAAPWEEYSMVSGGLRHLKFWSISGPTLLAKKALFGKLEKNHSTTITRAVNHYYVPNDVRSNQGREAGISGTASFVS